MGDGPLNFSGTAAAATQIGRLVRRVWKDQARSAEFRLGRSGRQALLTAFASLQSLEDYYAFASDRFGLLQIKREMLEFLEFARSDSPRHVCEIGASPGGTAFLLSQCLPTVSLFVGIDLYVANRAQLGFLSRGSRSLQFINGFSHWPVTVVKVKRVLHDRPIDLLFIDGDHSYSGVRRDFLAYRGLVKEGGLIAFHDIVPDHHTRHGIETPCWTGDVPRFWSRIKGLYEHREFVENPEQDGFGIGVVRYSRSAGEASDLV